MIEQKGHRLSVVNAADGFGQQWGDRERPELGAIAEEEEKKQCECSEFSEFSRWSQRMTITSSSSFPPEERCH